MRRKSDEKGRRQRTRTAFVLSPQYHHLTKITNYLTSKSNDIMSMDIE